jgi:hypothetical protein
MEYAEFLEKKRQIKEKTGFKIKPSDVNPMLFDFQRDIVVWAVGMGKAAIFAMTGLGKTFMQCEYAKHVTNKTKCRAIILAPLAVSQQTIKEATKIGIIINDIKKKENKSLIDIINYEQIENIDPSIYDCIILDESSIIKNYAGKTKNLIIEKFRHCNYKLSCSATPAPNDFMELGNQSEFLDVMKRKEMLSMFFIHDSGETQTWRIKGHAENIFWSWVSSWAAIITKPSDLGYDDTKYNLPPLQIKDHIVKTEKPIDGHLFRVDARTLEERRAAKNISLDGRVELAAKIVNGSDDVFLVWCNQNNESEMLKKRIKDAYEIKGSDSVEHKEYGLIEFAKGNIKCLITKPSIAGHGMNWQKCHNMIFVGLSDSFEQYFQAIRRCYRFGQKKPVNVNIIVADIDTEIIKNIDRKEKQSEIMMQSMIEHTKKHIIDNIRFHKKQNKIDGMIKMKVPKFCEVAL